MRNEVFTTEEFVGRTLEDVRLREDHHPLVGVVGHTNTGVDCVLDGLERLHREGLGEAFDELLREIRRGSSKEQVVDVPVGRERVVAHYSAADARLGVANGEATPLGSWSFKDFVALSLKDVAGLYEALDSFALPFFDKDHKVGATIRLQSPPQRSRPFARCTNPRRE